MPGQAFDRLDTAVESGLVWLGRMGEGMEGLMG